MEVRSSLKLHSSTLAFELPLLNCQWRTLDISFTKLLLNTLEQYLVTSNLTFVKMLPLRCCLCLTEVLHEYRLWKNMQELPKN